MRMGIQVFLVNLGLKRLLLVRAVGLLLLGRLRRADLPRRAADNNRVVTLPMLICFCCYSAQRALSINLVSAPSYLLLKPINAANAKEGFRKQQAYIIIN